jgi:hypothetical protein
MPKQWLPEIMYEGGGDEGLTNNIPFIPVPNGEHMPQFLFVFESRETGEFEPGPEGEELAVTELDLHQYADMATLKSKLDDETFDKVRAALGLEPLQSAIKKGEQISSNVRKNLGI